LNNSANGLGADSSVSVASQSESADNVHSIPFRTLHKEGFYFQENEFTDIYSPIVGPFAAMIYERLCRNSYGNPRVEYSVRDLARGMSPASAARAIQVLGIVGLTERLPTSGNRKSACQLFDVKALAESHGAMRPRKSAPFELPALTVDRLKAQVKAVRQSQQGKTKARAISCGKRNVEIAAPSGFHSLFSVSQRDASVSHLIRKRATRETQSGTHLLQEERRIEEIPTPTPTPNGSGKAEEDKDSPDEDEPDGQIRWARIKFTGVIDDMRAHLLDTSRPPAPHLGNGAADWEDFGLGSLAVEAVAQQGKALILTLSARDPMAARAALERYRPVWEPSLRKWYECEVRWEIPERKRTGRTGERKCTEPAAGG
jgi:hypothetical protein